MILLCVMALRGGALAMTGFGFALGLGIVGLGGLGWCDCVVSVVLQVIAHGLRVCCLFCCEVCVVAMSSDFDCGLLFNSFVVVFGAWVIALVYWWLLFRLFICFIRVVNYALLVGFVCGVCLDLLRAPCMGCLVC